MKIFDISLNKKIYRKYKQLKYDENNNVVNESFVGSENDYEKYKNVINDLIYEYFDKNEICGIELNPFRFEEDEVDSIQIKIIFKEKKDFRVFHIVKEQLKETIRTYIPLFYKVFINRQIGFCPDNLTESIGKTNFLDQIKTIVEPFKEEQCVCDVRVLYNDEDDMYYIEPNFSLESLNDVFFSQDGRSNYMRKLRKDIRDSIENYLPIKNLYVGSVTSPKCGFKTWFEDINEAHKVDPSEYVELYRNDDFILTIPLTHSASKKYGSDAKWCTTKKDCDKDFKKHTELGVLGYVVIRNNELKERLGSNAFAIYRLFGDGVGRSIVFDDQNNEYRNGESWLANKFDRVDKLFQFYNILNKFNEYFDKQKEIKIIKESKDYSNILDMIKTFGIVDTLKYTGVRPTKIPKLIDVTQIPNEKIFEFLDHIASTQSPWITDYEIQPIEMEDDYGRTVEIESFGMGSVDVTILEDEERYTIDYELLDKDIFYKLFNVALFMYGKDIQLLEETDRSENKQNYFKKIEKVIDSNFKSQYDWWKDIKIKDITFSKKPFYVMTVYATIEVDKEWGKKQWEKYYPEVFPFPGNKGWETGIDADNVSLSDIAGGEFMADFKKEFINIMRYITNEEVLMMQLSPLKLKFV